MNYLEERNQKIIEAVIQKADAHYPGSLALIGIYGSFLTGDYHEKSDLDLLIVINDEKAGELGCAFIQDDLDVGHDIYCVTWDHLEEEADFTHPNISKLMDAEIVYCADEKYRERLEALRKQVREILDAPFSANDYEKAEKQMKDAEHYYTLAMISESLCQVRQYAGGTLYYIENAIAMLNKQYFRQGVKRACKELDAMKIRPENLSGLIENMIKSVSVSEVKDHLTRLMKENRIVFDQVKAGLSVQKEPASPAALSGTYEEMYSNWRNKIHLAGETGNKHLSFMSLVSANAMLEELFNAVDIDRHNAVSCYDPEDLKKTAAAYDDVLAAYLKEYRKAGIPERRYPDIDAFVEDYE